MKLIVQELKNTLTQVIQVGEDPLNVVAIRPHLYRHGAPAGSLQVQVQRSDGAVIAASEVIAISSMPAGAFWHGYLRFMASFDMQKSTNYNLTLVPSGGYVFSESAYIGWCKDYDLRKVPALYAPNLGMSSALDVELWANQNALDGGWKW